MRNKAAVAYRATRIVGNVHRSITVHEVLWFDARKAAMKILGCGPDELTVEREPEAPAPAAAAELPVRSRPEKKPKHKGKKERR